jgi:hypothetical protein
MNPALWLCAAVLAASILPEISGSSPDAATIVRRSVKANVRNYNALPDFNFFRVEREQDGANRTYEEKMLFGSRYSLLVALNGEPLSPEREKYEEMKLTEAIRLRAGESFERRRKRVASYEQARQRDQMLLNEMAKAFDLTLAGEEQLGAHQVYVLKAKPRPGYRPPDSRAKVLTGMEGTLWIEKKSCQWVKVEAEVIRPVSIEGFLARVQPGTHFELDQAPVSEDFWMPVHFSMKTRAKVLFFFSKTSDVEAMYYGYYSAAPALKN